MQKFDNISPILLNDSNPKQLGDIKLSVAESPSHFFSFLNASVILDQFSNLTSPQFSSKAQ